jgi:CheY-like chemotaxis protein
MTTEDNFNNLFAAESVEQAKVNSLPGWKVLLVDDELDIHTMLKMLLQSIIIDERPLEILEAESSIQAKEILKKNDDINLILLDVVMESNEAGLELVEYIRNTLQELLHGDYKARTEQNVIDSDGTIIIYFGTPTGGTELTIAICIKEHKPYLLIDAEEIIIDRAIQRVSGFVQNKKVINIAGPRSSDEPKAYDYARSVISGYLSIKK